MKLAITLLPVLIVGATATTYIPFVTFNDGQISPGSCSAEEMTLISNQVAQASSGGRRLGSQSRELTVRQKCTPLMAFAGVPKCGGSHLTRSLNTGGRKLNTIPCGGNIAKFNATLDSVMPQLSPSCQAFIGIRSFSCREPLPCDIAKIHLWNAGEDRIQRRNLPTDGVTRPVLCTQLYASFEAVTAFDVGQVTFTITGSNGYNHTWTELYAPYFAFKNNGADVFGQHMDIGNYTLTAYSTNAPTTPKTVLFRMHNC